MKLNTFVSNSATALLKLLGITAVCRNVGNNSLNIPLNGHPFRKLFFDKNYWRNHAEAVFLERLLEHVNEGDCVFDIGAFRGHYTLTAALQVGPLGRVFAFEPNPASFRTLQATLQANPGKLENIEIICKAVSDEKGEVLFSANHAGSHIGGEDGSRCNLKVQQTTVDHIAEELHAAPSVLKLDVEGFEMKVLAGAKATLSSCRAIAVEIHPKKMMQASGDTPEELIDFIEKYGFILEFEYKQEKHKSDVSRPYNVLFVKPSQVRTV